MPIRAAGATFIGLGLMVLAWPGTRADGPGSEAPGLPSPPGLEAPGLPPVPERSPRGDVPESENGWVAG